MWRGVGGTSPRSARHGLWMLGLAVAFGLGGCAGARADNLSLPTLLMGARLQGRLQAQLEPLCRAAAAPTLPGTACQDLAAADQAFTSLLTAASAPASSVPQGQAFLEALLRLSGQLGPLLGILPK